jgi:hypothetical protein
VNVFATKVTVLDTFCEVSRRCRGVLLVYLGGPQRTVGAKQTLGVLSVNSKEKSKAFHFRGSVGIFSVIPVTTLVS